MLYTAVIEYYEGESKVGRHLLSSPNLVGVDGEFMYVHTYNGNLFMYAARNVLRVRIEKEADNESPEQE